MNTGTPGCQPPSMLRSSDSTLSNRPVNAFEYQEFSDVLVLHICMNPIAWKAPIATVRRSGGRYFAAAAPVPELVAYQEGLREETRQQWLSMDKVEPLRCPVHLDWVFRRQLPSYTSPTTGRTVTKHRQDLTNLVKAAEDAIQPHIIANDSQVASCTARFDGEQSKDIDDPYVEVTVRWDL